MPLSQDQRTELIEHISSYDSRTRARGTAYEREGRAEIHTARDRYIHGYVRGTETYEVTIDYDDNVGWDSECDCPVSFDCKHAYALAKAVLKQENATPTTSKKKADNRAPKSPTAIAKQKLDRNLTAKESHYLQRIEKAWRQYSREGGANDDVLTLLQNRDVTYHCWSSIDRLSIYLDSPASAPLELLGYACVHFKLNNITIPTLAKKLLPLEDYQKRAKRNLTLNEIRTWRQTLEASTPIVRETNSTAQAPIELAMVLGRSKWEIHARSGDSPYYRVDSAQLRDWQYAAASELSTQAIAFLGTADSFIESWRGATTSPKTENARAFLHDLLAHPELRHHVLDTQHQPIAWSPEPLRWTTKKAGKATEPTATLSISLPNGKPIPKPPLILQNYLVDHYGETKASSDASTFYLIDQVVYPGPPPLQGKTHVEMPWEAVASEQGVAFLHSHQAPLPRELTKKVKTIQPQLVLRAQTSEQPSSWGSAHGLQIEIEARDPQNRTLRVFTQNGWQRHETASDTTSNDDIQLVDPQAFHDFSKPLTNHGIKWTDYTENWYKSLPNSQSLPNFGDWLSTLPADLKIELSPDLAGLDTKSIKASYEVQVSETPSQDWFDVSLVRRIEDTTLTPEETKLLLAAPGRFVQLPSGQWRRLDVETDPQSTHLKQEFGFENSESTQRLHTLQLENEAQNEAFSEHAQQTLHQRLDALRSLDRPAPPKGFAKILRPYQTEGYQFLCQLSQLNFGGILADDMGLGKTLQALAWLVWLRKQKPSNPKPTFRTLIICPKSVTDNWLTEPTKFKTGLTAARHHGKPDKEQAKALKSAQLVVANYTQLRTHADTFLAEDWDAIILDEAQYIKNPGSQTARVACQLRSAHRLVLTGTPIENRALDLWSLMRFAMPGALSSQAQFKRLYNEKKDPQALARLGRRIQPFLLRRTKTKVAKDLPARVEEELHCQLEGPQAKLYQAELKKAQQLLLGIKNKQQFDKSRFNILQSLLRLRQISCAPQLVGAKTAKTFVPAKIQALFELLEPLLAEGHKILIFSQFVSMLEILQTHLTTAGIAHLTLTGKTENRHELVERFQKPDTEQVFLLSLKAAGSGLNLTAASYVLLFDPWWNPAVEAQAIDRTHRIGQKNQVIAYRLIAKNTIEEKIRSLQKEKSNLANSIIDDNALATTLDLDQIRTLLTED